MNSTSRLSLSKDGYFVSQRSGEKYIVRYSLNHEENDNASILPDLAIAGSCFNGILDNHIDIDYRFRRAVWAC